MTYRLCHPMHSPKLEQSASTHENYNDSLKGVHDQIAAITREAMLAKADVDRFFCVLRT